MDRRLVIPADQDENTAAPWGPTWGDVAKDNGVLIARSGDVWCVANKVDGLGIVSERPPDLPPPVPGQGGFGVVGNTEEVVAQLLKSLASAQSITQIQAAATAAITLDAQE